MSSVMFQHPHSHSVHSELRTGIFLALTSRQTSTFLFVCFYHYNPMCVANVVIGRDSSDNSSWWKPHFISSFENTLFPLISRHVSSIVEIGNLSRSIASFAWRMSTYNRMSELFDFATTTIGLTNEVGPSARSMISSSLSSAISLRPLIWDWTESFFLPEWLVWHFVSHGKWSSAL